MVADFRTQIQDGAIYIATDDCGVSEGFIVFYPEAHYVLLENVALFSGCHRAWRWQGADRLL